MFPVQEAHPLEYLFSLHQKKAPVRVEMMDGAVIEGSILGLDEHINLVIEKKETRKICVVYGYNVIEVNECINN